ncbi:Putative thiazole biosynthetic enzyme [bacterium HR21]|nr:Putative thiazole biosynthetic enzyme [bacterium HR21]
MDEEDNDTLRLHLWYQRREPAHQLFWRPSHGLSPTRRIRCDVLVIGAGPAGLTSAWLLHQLGYEVLVLEHEPTIGGATRTEQWQGAVVPCGALYIGEISPLLEELLRQLQLQLLPLPVDALALNGCIYPRFWDASVLCELPLARHERDALRRFREKIPMLPAPPYPLPEQPWTWLAAQTAAEFVRPYGSAFLLRLLSAYTRSTMGAPAELVSAYCLRDFLGDELAGERRRFSLPGGLATFCHRLADKLGRERIWCPATAFHSEHCATGNVRTLCQSPDGDIVAIEAAAVVFAGPKFLAKHLFPELPPAHRQAILRLRYAPYLTVHVHTPFRLVPENTFEVWLPEARLVTDIADVTALQPQPIEGFLSCLYVPLSAQQRGLLLEEASVRQLVAAAVREALQQLLPAQAAASIECTCFVWGHGLVIPTPEALCGAAQQARRPVGRIVFANTDNDASPAFENALEHALRAAETVHKFLRPHSWHPSLRRRFQLEPALPDNADPLQPMDRALPDRRTAPPAVAPPVYLPAPPDKR